MSPVVVTASPESGYTHTNDDILDIPDPEIRRVDGSVQLLVRSTMQVDKKLTGLGSYFVLLITINNKFRKLKKLEDKERRE